MRRLLRLPGLLGLDLWTGTALLGLGLIAEGCRLVFTPAAYIVPGTLLLIAAVWGTLSLRPPRPPQ